MGDLSSNIDLQHLLRATNHLKIAQNEFEKGKPVMLALLQSVNVSKVIAVGEKSRIQLGEMGIDASMVRHPANGGAPKFREQIIQVIKNKG